MAAGQTISINALGEQIGSLVKEINSCLEQTGKTGLNFEEDSDSPEFTPEYEKLRCELNTAASDLLRLVNGPRNELRTFLTYHYDFAAYQVALQFNYFTIVPLHGTISLKQLASTAGMDEDRTMRTVRMLVTHRVFREEVIDGVIHFGHTAASAVIAKEPLLYNVFAMEADEVFRAASATAESIRQNPYRSDRTSNAYTAAYGTEFYEFYQQNPAKAERFSKAMAGWTQLDRQTTELYQDYDWQSLPKGKVVDVGGGSGYISKLLAERFSHLDFMVQDISSTMLAQGKKVWPEELESRVQFMVHDYLTPQPVHDAVAFFTRQVTHNLADNDLVTFFRAFVPALERCHPGTPLLINDTVLPEPGETSLYMEHRLRQADLAMWVKMGAKQRTVQDFRILLEKADKRFELVDKGEMGTMSLLHVQLRSET